MNGAISLFTACLLVSGMARAEILPEPPREFRAAWVATVANIDWPSNRNLSTEKQKEELLAILDKAEAINLNAIIFQIRPMADALYASELEPWSEFLTGQAGRAPDPFYDPLEFMIRESHARGMELHVWFNPYRAKHPSHRTELPEDHVWHTKREIVREYGNYLWMDPAAEGTKRHTLDVILDVVRRYNVDGVHIDDYFYPYKSYGDGADFPDDDLWEAYLADGGDMSRSDWRRSHVNDFVERFYNEVKEEDPTVKVGISPFGIWRPGYPEGITGLDQYEHLYADARLWLNKGWVDYYTPQLYWPIEQTAQAYPRLLEWWVGENHENRHMWPGNFTSRVQRDGGWDPQEIVNQVIVTREQEGATGNVHFSMIALLQNRQNLADLLAEGVYRRPALVPASPWLDASAPEAPVVSQRGTFWSRTRTVSWQPGCDKEIRNWVIHTKRDGEWEWDIVPPAAGRELRFHPRDGITEMAVVAVDKVGNLSAPTRLQAR